MCAVDRPRLSLSAYSSGSVRLAGSMHISASSGFRFLVVLSCVVRRRVRVEKFFLCRQDGFSDFLHRLQAAKCTSRRSVLRAVGFGSCLMQRIGLMLERCRGRTSSFSFSIQLSLAHWVDQRAIIFFTLLCYSASVWSCWT